MIESSTITSKTPSAVQSPSEHIKSTPRKLGQKKLNLALLIVMMFGIVGISSLIYANFKVADQITLKNTAPSPSSSVTSSVSDSDEEWMTYVNPNLGLSFTYPTHEYKFGVSDPCREDVCSVSIKHKKKEVSLGIRFDSTPESAEGGIHPITQVEAAFMGSGKYIKLLGKPAYEIIYSDEELKNKYKKSVGLMENGALWTFEIESINEAESIGEVEKIFSSIKLDSNLKVRKCPNKFSFWDTKYYSVCLPEGFEVHQQMTERQFVAEYRKDWNTESKAWMMVQIERDYDYMPLETIGCTKNYDTFVSGFPATQQWYIPVKNGICSSEIVSFKTLIGESYKYPLPYNLIFHIDVRGDNSNNLPDAVLYSAIEQSLIIKF